MQPNSRILHDPHPFFLSTFPSEALRGMGQSIVGAYRQADEYCQALFWTQAHDLRPQLRRSLAENNIQISMPRFSGISVEPTPNNIKSSYHILVRYQYIYLTTSSTESPSRKPRKAVHRENYALSSQIDLFIPSEPLPIDGSLYGVIIHGPAKKYQDHPSFMYIVFPNRDWTDYVGGHIDLLSRFPELKGTTSEVEHIKKPAPPKLRKNQQAEGNV